MPCLNFTRRLLTSMAVAGCFAALAVASAAAQPETAPPRLGPTTATTQPAATQPAGVLPAGDFRPSSPAPEEEWFALPPLVEFWPPLEGAALTWFAVVLILALSFRLKPLLCERNLDALVLAATCLLLALRNDVVHTGLPGWLGQHTGQWWSYVLLSVAAAYWLLRGLRCMVAQTIPRAEGNVSKSAVFILALAGLAVAVQHIASDPLTSGSRDGVIGGLCLAETGKLPYGEASGHDAQSPLLYALHAGAVRIAPPATTELRLDREAAGGAATSTTQLAALTVPPPGIEMTWANRGTWLTQSWWQSGDFASVRLVNGLLFVLFLLALYALGHHLHSTEIGLTLVTIFCVFPGAIGCVSRPDIMLPAVLLAWSATLALVPGIGGLGSCLLIVLAGVAWPWAWLALPLLLAYSFRHGWEAVGGLVGTLGGVAAILTGLVWLAAPTLPRADGALCRADLMPAYTASRSADSPELVIAPREAGPTPARGWLGWFWRFLVTSESLALDTAATGPGLSRVQSGQIDPRKLLYQKLEPRGDEARAELTQRYRAALETQTTGTRMCVALRGVLEHTWLAPPSDVGGPWALWSGAAAEKAGGWLLARKIVRIVAGVLAILVAVMLFRGRRPQSHQVLGGLLVVSSATLLASDAGAVTNLVWLLPTVLALWAVNQAPPVQPRPLQRTLADLDAGLPPRITVER